MVDVGQHCGFSKLPSTLRKVRAASRFFGFSLSRGSGTRLSSVTAANAACWICLNSATHVGTWKYTCVLENALGIRWNRRIAGANHVVATVRRLDQHGERLIVSGFEGGLEERTNRMTRHAGILELLKLLNSI